MSNPIPDAGAAVPARSTGEPATEAPSAPANRPLPAVRIGLAGGAVGMLCCLGPTILALVGMVSASTAYVLANDLYAGYAWWFRLGGLAVAAALVVVGLRRRRSCSLDGARAARRRLALVALVGVATYAALYGLTTLAGSLAGQG